MGQPWRIGAQLSTSHSLSSALSLDRVMEVVERARSIIDLDILIVGARENPAIFRAMSNPGASPGEGGVPLVQPPLRHRRDAGIRPCRELARGAKPWMGWLGGKRSGGPRDVPVRVPKQPRSEGKNAPPASRVARPVSLRRRFPRQDTLSVTGQRSERGIYPAFAITAVERRRRSASISIPSRGACKNRSFQAGPRRRLAETAGQILARRARRRRTRFFPRFSVSGATASPG